MDIVLGENVETTKGGVDYSTQHSFGRYITGYRRMQLSISVIAI